MGNKHGEDNQAGDDEPLRVRTADIATGQPRPPRQTSRQWQRRLGVSEEWGKRRGILLHLAGKPTMAMKDGGQKVIGNEEEDDFGRPAGNPSVARTKKDQRLSEAALTLTRRSSPRHPGKGLVSCQVFLITRQIRGDQARSEPSPLPSRHEEKRRKFRKVESRRGGLLRNTDCSQISRAGTSQRGPFAPPSERRGSVLVAGRRK